MLETKSIRETCVQLDSDIDKGLTEKEAARRYEENGKNEEGTAEKDGGGILSGAAE